MLENKIEDPRPASPIPLAPLINLKECKIKQLLNNDAARKKIVLLVENSTETENNQGIVIVEKIEFAAKNFPTDLQRSEDDSEPEILKLIQVANTFQNDIYADYFGILEGRLNRKFTSAAKLSHFDHFLSFRIESLHNLSGNRSSYQEVLNSRILPHRRDAGNL